MKIERVLDYHIMLSDSSAYYLLLPPEKLERPSFFRGIQMPRLMNSAFLTGVQTVILNDLPVHKIQALNQLYSFQDIYNDLNNMIISGLLNMNFTSNPDDLYRITIFINTTMNDVTELERALLEFYSIGKTRLTEG